MTVKELRELLNHQVEKQNDNESVSVLLDLPSIGPRAHSKVKSASFGFDWDRGLQFKTEASLCIKNDKQSIYEAAYDLLAWIATKRVKKETYEIRTAKKILEKYGWDKEKFAQVQIIYHREPK